MAESRNIKIPVIFVVGSTASGKSDWALELAQRYNGVIINADSVQFYKGLEVGSASPSTMDKACVPHRLYNYVCAPMEMTAGQFVRDFYQLLETENFSGPLFVVGGTGFYLQSLEKGMFNVPEVSAELKEQIELEMEQQGADKAYQELISFDPNTKVHPNDHYRIGRSLEVKRAFGKKMSEFQSEQKNLIHNGLKNSLQNPFLKIGTWLEKELLLEKVQARTKLMLKNAMIEEVKNCLDNGFANWSPLSSVGYNEVKQMLGGSLPVDQLEGQIIKSTMQLIKKQKTWFKRDSSILWSNDEKTKKAQIEMELDQFLIAHKAQN